MGFKIRFYHNQLSGQLEFLISERLPDGRRRILKPIESLMTEIVEQTAEIKPTFIMPTFDAMEVLKDLAEQLDEKGIKTPQDAKIEGTMEATRRHLEDLRKLIFEKRVK